MLTVRDTVQSNVVTVTPDASVRDLAPLLADEQTSGVPVTELCDFLVRGRTHRAVVINAKRFEGIVTSADVLRAVSDGRSGR